MVDRLGILRSLARVSTIYKAHLNLYNKTSDEYEKRRLLEFVVNDYFENYSANRDSGVYIYADVH